MTRGVVIALGVAAAVLVAVVIYMRRQSTPGTYKGVPFYTPGAPNVPGGPPLPGSNKLSSFLQGVTATAKSAEGAADALTSLWQKTGKSWGSEASSTNNTGGSNSAPLNSWSELQA